MSALLCYNCIFIRQFFCDWNSKMQLIFIFKANSLFLLFLSSHLYYINANNKLCLNVFVFILLLLLFIAMLFIFVLFENIFSSEYFLLLINLIEDYYDVCKRLKFAADKIKYCILFKLFITKLIILNFFSLNLSFVKVIFDHSFLSY